MSQHLYWTEEKDCDPAPAIVVRDNGDGWIYAPGVGDYRGRVVTIIPYCEEESRLWAIGIANQIIEKIKTRFVLGEGDQVLDVDPDSIAHEHDRLVADAEAAADDWRVKPEDFF